MIDNHVALLYFLYGSAVQKVKSTSDWSILVPQGAQILALWTNQNTKETVAETCLSCFPSELPTKKTLLLTSKLW